MSTPEPAETTTEPTPGHPPFCRCGHKDTVHAAPAGTGQCVLRRCNCGRFERRPKPTP